MPSEVMFHDIGGEVSTSLRQIASPGTRALLAFLVTLHALACYTEFPSQYFIMNATSHRAIRNHSACTPLREGPAEMDGFRQLL
jgi:hypothetical protein